MAVMSEFKRILVAAEVCVLLLKTAVPAEVPPEALAFPRIDSKFDYKLLLVPSSWFLLVHYWFPLVDYWFLRKGKILRILLWSK